MSHYFMPLSRIIGVGFKSFNRDDKIIGHFPFYAQI